MRFIADGMLGKLTRWLRILGHDVKYSTEASDAQLIAVSKKEKRVLLTRDLELYRQATAKSIETFYLEGQTGEEKLAELAKRYHIGLEVDVSMSRCPKCNTPVSPVSKKKIEGKVEENTLAHYNEYWKCRKCGQIYWQGSHWIGIRRALEKAKRISSGNQKHDDYMSKCVAKS